MHNRQMSFKSGVMTCWSNINGSQWELVQTSHTDNFNDSTKGLLKAINTSCKAMKHTDIAAKYARQCCFAMLDLFGLNSLSQLQHQMMNAALG